jgi:large subunit ribosomal protein L13
MIKLTNTTKPVSEKAISHGWHLIDVKGKILGRTIPEIVYFLTGKNKTNYAPYLDMGDNVVVINASKVLITGKKEQKKIYASYSGYPGGLREISYEEMMIKNPKEIIRHGVSGMLPKNKLRDRRLARLFIFKDENHPYAEKLKVKS